jgi:hypothetical protein
MSNQSDTGEIRMTGSEILLNFKRRITDLEDGFVSLKKEMAGLEKEIAAIKHGDQARRGQFTE